MSKSRLLAVAAAGMALALPACRSGRGPRAGRAEAPAAPGLVQQLVGQSRILRHRGHERRLSFKREDLTRLSGGCDAAVDVRQASLRDGTLRLTLAHLGRPHVPGRPERRRGCRPASETTVAVSRVISEQAVHAALDALLPTPEQYLRAHGKAFDRPAADPTAGPVADEASAAGEDRTAARQVTAWPVPLLKVDADVPRGRVGVRESEVDFAGVVGTDGRLHAARVLSPLSDDHTRQVTRALSLWRYQPARAGRRELPARVTGKTVLRLY